MKFLKSFFLVTLLSLPFGLVQADSPTDAPCTAPASSAACSQTALQKSILNNTTSAVVTPLGFQPLTSLGSATALTVPAGSRIVVVTVEGTSIRWRDDGTNPTTTVGQILVAGQAMVYGGNLSTIRFIQTSASATINASYYK